MTGRGAPVFGDKDRPGIAPASDATSRPFTLDGGMMPTGSTNRNVAELRHEWEALVAASDNLYVQYQTPEWFDHLLACTNGNAPGPIVVRDRNHKLVGIAPYNVREQALDFVARDMILARFPLRAVSLMGGTPLAEPDAEVHDRIYDMLAAANPKADCLYFHSVRVGSFAWNHLQSSKLVRRKFIVHLPRGIVPFHSLIVPETFDIYLQQFRSKKRYNLSRQLRLLREKTGDVVCERIDSPDQIPGLLQAAATVLPRAWQLSLMVPELYATLTSSEQLHDLVERRLLRSYVLRCGGVPRALVLGYQHHGIFHYAEIAYDRDLAHFSPGSTLLYLLIQDLIAHNRPRFVNLGIGHAEYKRIFGNVHAEDASVILFRKTWVNRLRYATHRSFTAAIHLVKACRSATARLAKSSRNAAGPHPA